MKFDRDEIGTYFREDGRMRTLEESRAEINLKNKQIAARPVEKKKQAISIYVFSLLIVAAFLFSIVMFVMKKPFMGAYGLISVGIFICVSVLISPKKEDGGIDIGKIIASLVVLLFGGVAFFFYSVDSGRITLTTQNWFLLGAVLLAVAVVALVLAKICVEIGLKNRCTMDINAECIGYLDRVALRGKHNHVVESAPVFRIYYNGEYYESYLKNDFTSEEKDLPHIGERVEIKFDPADPYVCKHPKGFAHHDGLLFCAFVCLWFSAGLWLVSFDYAGASNETELNDKYIRQQVGTDDFLVFERQVAGYENRLLYFSEMGGIHNVFFSDEPYERGDNVYWVQLESGDVYLFDAKMKPYTGEKTAKNSNKYTSDGKFILTDDYLKKIYYNDDITVTDVVVSAIEDEVILTEDEEGGHHGVYMDEELRYLDYKVGEELYWVTIGYEENVRLYRKKYNVYMTK